MIITCIKKRDSALLPYTATHGGEKELIAWNATLFWKHQSYNHATDH